MTETFEYGYLHLLDVTAIRTSGDREWVGVVQTGSGMTVHDSRESALSIMNQLGQEGWMISDAQGVKITDNKLPTWLRPIIFQSFGRLGVAHSLQSRFMTRRITWADDPPSKAGGADLT